MKEFKNLAEANYMGNSGDKVTISSMGKGDSQSYVLINKKTYDLVNMEFTSEEEAKKYADKKKLKIVESTDVENQLKKYIMNIQKASDERTKKSFPVLWDKGLHDVYDYTKGKRYYKITVTNNGGKGQTSVFAFIDANTGDIYKPAGWKAPAKGIRGNIFNDKMPLSGRELYRR